MLLAAACASTPLPAQPVTGPRHVVALIHGVLGDAGHFGRMQDALTAHLPAAEPGFRVDVFSFEYDTLDAVKRTTDFARDLDAALDAKFPGGPRPGDRLSFVMHSQGGLVGLAWLEHAAVDDDASRALLARMDAFVALATPWWGSKVATLTRYAEPLLATKRDAPARAPADAQLRDMSFGSDALVARRRALVASTLPRPPGLRPLAIGSYVAWLAPLAPVAAGADLYEDDTAVLLPSSQPNFLWVDARDGAARSGEAVFAPSLVVDAIHLSPAVESPQASRGIAQVQSACVDDAACDHPTFPLVLAHLARKPVDASRDRRPAMTSFLVDVVVGYDPARAGAATAVNVALEPIGDGVVIGERDEPMSTGRSLVATAVDEARVYFVGRAPKGGAGAVRVKVTAPGHAPLVVEAPVRAAQTTFVDARLTPSP